MPAAAQVGLIFQIISVYEFGFISLTFMKQKLFKKYILTVRSIFFTKTILSIIKILKPKLQHCLIL